jgi:integrase
MRGHLFKRPSGAWVAVLTLGYQKDSTGKVRQKQRWITLSGCRTKKQAQEKMREHLTAVDKGTFVEPSKLTLGTWLTEWLEKAVKPPLCRRSTYVRYTNIVEAIQKGPIADIPLQKLRPSDIERYYADATNVAPGTLSLHHTVIHRALRKAKRDNLVAVNVASDLEGRPRSRRDPESARQNCWTTEEAQTFLAVARQAGPQDAAFYSLAVETGMRKSELCGLRWTDIDLDAGVVAVVRQLTKPGPEPTFGPPKNGRARDITITPETVELLRAHKRRQAELKMANRTTYCDHGLTFAKEYGDLTNRKDLIGQPLQANNLGERSFRRLIKAAKVRPITFHGLRHTSATMQLRAGVEVHVVARRLGHSDVSITLNVYAHALPDMQRSAATKIGALLHG